MPFFPEEVKPDVKLTHVLTKDNTVDIPQEEIHETFTKVIKTHVNAREKLFEFLTILVNSQNIDDEKPIKIQKIPVQTMRQFLIAAEAKQTAIQGEISLNIHRPKDIHIERYEIEEEGTISIIQIFVNKKDNVEFVIPVEAKKLIQKRLNKYLTEQPMGDASTLAPEEDENQIKQPVQVANPTLGLFFIVTILVIIPNSFDAYIDFLMLSRPNMDQTVLGN